MGIKKITLIEPKAPGRHVYSFIRMPRLGLPLIATQLKQRGFQVRFIYESGARIRTSDILDADLVGISTTTSTCQEAYNIAGYIRQKGIPVVIGGVHASFLPQEALGYCDYVCRGEADHSFVHLVECLDRGAEPLTVPGLSYYREGSLVENPLPELPDMESLPVPDPAFLTELGLNCIPVMTSRGCPYDCTFCCVTRMFGRHYRHRSLEQSLAELAPYSGRMVFICDDNFTAHPRRTKALLKAMIDRGEMPSWWGAQVRVETARDQEMLELMKRANCKMVYVGMESVNPRTLEAFNKKQGLEDIDYCIKAFHNHGIMVHGMFVLGGDDDDVATVQETLKYTVASNLDTVQYMNLVPLPGTPLFQEMEAGGRLLTRDWRFYDGHHVVFMPQRMTPWELQSETLKAYKAFYSPLRLARSLAGKSRQALVHRAAGFYLTQVFSRESRRYSEYLKGLSRKPDFDPAFTLSKTVESFRLKRFRYLSTEKILDLEIMEQKDAFLIELRGCLNKMALREVVATLRGLVGQHYKELVINIGQMSFGSEDVLKAFIRELDKVAGLGRRVQLKTTLGEAFMNTMEKYDLSLPNFQF
ncbi:MAG TPA: radical SAM protein [Syntrophomonadaceae bacterium]|nr:radical SAM protein [Syntrophomonadaceae bacterium]